MKGLRARAIIAVLLGCVLRQPAVAALTDGRRSGGVAVEATGDARCANLPGLSQPYKILPTLGG